MATGKRWCVLPNLVCRFFSTACVYSSMCQVLLDYLAGYRHTSYAPDTHATKWRGTKNQTGSSLSPFQFQFAFGGAVPSSIPHQNTFCRKQKHIYYVLLIFCLLSDFYAGVCSDSYAGRHGEQRRRRCFSRRSCLFGLRAVILLCG